MITDKQLIREGKYKEALGKNYSKKPYYILLFTNGNPTGEGTQFYETFDEALKECKESEYKEYYIGNLNADWL